MRWAVYAPILALGGGGNPKRPLSELCRHGVTDATRDQRVIRSWAPRALAYGVACGHPLPHGGHLLCIDQDDRNGGAATMTALVRDLGELPPTVRQKSHSGGPHWMFSTPTPIASGKLGPGIDVLGVGKYFKLSTPTPGSRPGEIPFAPLPGKWLRRMTSHAHREPVSIDGSARGTVVGLACQLAGLVTGETSDGALLIRCPQTEQHSPPHTDTSSVALPKVEGGFGGFYQCMHSGCRNLRGQGIFKALPHAIVIEAARRLRQAAEAAS